MKIIAAMKTISVNSSYGSLCGLILLGLGVLSFVGCDQHSTTSMTSTGVMPKRSYDRDVVALGGTIYKTHCVRCHGENAEGNLQWRKPDAQGKYPPPPLNGTGHAWHHSRLVLRGFIENGSEDGKGNMPAWRDVLSEREIEAVITWFQSLWPDQVYAAWYEMQQNIER